MAYSINPEIPLQAKQFDFGRGFELMQQAQLNNAKLQEHKLSMQKLREDYDLAKEQRKQQKAMQMGIANDLGRIQNGTPAQYSQPSYAQTMPTGQMPQGMTGVLASERGQQIPQPQLFGENILQGNVDFNREMVSPAVAGREPSYIEMLKIGYRNAAMNQDIDSAFKFGNMIKQAEIAEREQNAPVGNPYPTYDAQGNFVGTRVMTKAGQEIAFGTQGTTTVKPDVLTTKDKTQLQFQKSQQEALFAQQKQLAEFNAKKQREIALLKPDPVEKALEIERGKETIKQDNAIKASQREKLANANDGLPLLDNYINALKESPQSGISESYQKAMGYVGMGSESKQSAMAKAKQAGEALLTFAQKQPGPSTDKDVASYRAQMGVVTDDSLPAPARVAAAEQAKALLLKIQAKYGNYQDGGGSQQQTTVNAKVTGQTKIVKTRADLDKVKSGESYIAPDGKLWVKP